MRNRPIILQMLWLLAAATLFAAAGAVHAPLARQGSEFELTPPQIAENYPAKTLLAMAPGGLRAPLVTYLWIRADKYKAAGRTHEAMQLADLICYLQPDFEGVWAFQAWNMAWNISVTTHTPEQRWLWVHNGVKLLRDRGIPLNPKALTLYKELGWIFFNKMGQYLDEMHMVYKQRWAALMQQVLAAPPQGETSEVIAAFRPIADAPLDKQPRRQAQQTIQADQLAIVLADPATAAYADLLGALGVQIDQGLLDAFNRFSMDEAASIVRLETVRTADEREKALAELINDPAHAAARDKLLAFVRAQVLWNVYRLDPDWMLQLMEKYGPLDWRLVQPHGLYWTTYGLHVCEAMELGDMNTANTDRLVLNALKAMTFNGRLTYVTNPQDPDAPYINWDADWRFVEPCQQEHIRMTQMISELRNEEYATNTFRSGHVNFLIQAIAMLYAGGRVEQARGYFEWIKENYKLADDAMYKLELEDFIIAQLNQDGTPIPDVARAQIRMALQAAFLELAAGDRDRFQSSFNYAQRVHRVFQENTQERNRLPDFAILVRNLAQAILIRPQLAGIYMSLTDRAALYGALDDRMQRMVYPQIAPELQKECAAEGIDFDKAFPVPAGMELVPQQSG